MVRDGRGFDAGADGAADPVLPGPNTVAGAVFAAYGGRAPEVVRGPVYARRDPAGGDAARWQLFFAVPQTIVERDTEPGSLFLLTPQAHEGWITDLADAGTQWLVGDGKPLGERWIRGDILTRYLHGELFSGDEPFVRLDDEELPRTGALLERENRIGLARDANRSVRQGLLYQTAHLRPKDGFALLAECELGEELAGSVPSGPTPLGGRGRLADVDVATGVDWPAPPPEYPDGRVLVYVATPAPWTTGWRLPLPAGASLVAAAVGKPVSVATASPRQGWERTRMLRWAVPPGSVYLLEFAGGAEPARAWAREHHARAWGMKIGRPEDDKLITTAGFGVILTGVWS